MGEDPSFCPDCGGQPVAGTTLETQTRLPRCEKCGKASSDAATTTGGASDFPPAPAGKCPYCLAGFQPGDEIGSCPKCQATYHLECWKENGGCAVYGCSQVPAIEGRAAIEIPFSYWGQENKPCPVCNQQILAAAKRCRHCGTTFASARPQGAAEFQSRAALEERLPAARHRVVTIFIFSVVPFLAPAGVVWGPLWSRGHREELAALPSLYPALVKVGFVAALVQTLAFAVLTVVYFFVSNR